MTDDVFFARCFRTAAWAFLGAVIAVGLGFTAWGLENEPLRRVAFVLTATSVGIGIVAVNLGFLRGLYLFVRSPRQPRR